MNDPRYDGKPLLRLVELWVLWVIDEIDPVDLDRLAEMEPKLRQTWSLTGTWHEMIESVLKITPVMTEEVQRMWRGNVETARERGVPPPKHAFAEAIADQIAAGA